MLPDSIPRIADADDFLKKPIQHLARGRASHGNLFVVREEGPIFSRAPDCAGVIAAFGIDNQRTILTDMESFELPISAAEKLKLPANLVNLNRSLHSMRGTEHSAQKRRLIGLLNRAESSHRAVWTSIEEETAKWNVAPVNLVQQMRELTFHASFRMLFGNGREVTRQLALLLQAYFHLRREVASAGATPDRETLEQLVETGNLLDSELRGFIRECGSGKSTSGLFAGMAAECGAGLSEDEIAGHMNVFFISTTEPVAVALSWVLLMLSQLPELRKELQAELKSMLPAGALPTSSGLNKLALLDSVVNETLRMLPPNALMTRITTKPVRLNGMEIPGRCEVLLSPFISQRDQAAFHRPDEFLPGRWRESPPSPFLYFPFGAGGHSCIGRGMAMDMIKTALAYLLPRFSPVLAEDQAMDWSIRIMLTPNPDPKMIFYPVVSQNIPRSGAIKGPLAAALSLGGV